MNETIPHLRVARPTNDIQKLLPFYRDALGLSVLGSFEDHQGFDGIMLGFPKSFFHLEFTLHHGHFSPSAPTKENLLVFYYPDEHEWKNIINRFLKFGFEPVSSNNPYWNKKGITFEDPDGYRIVLQQTSWEKSNKTMLK